MFGKITGVGSYVPKRVLQNSDLEKDLDTDSQWIIDRTGIERRHVMTYENASDMAIEAAMEAISQAGIRPEEIDLILLSSTSSDQILPNTACIVQKETGALNAMCIDMNVACTGFITAYNTAQTYIHAGLCSKALVIATEGLSKIVNWKDRGTAILFGDGAGAVVIEADENAVFESVMHADGRLGDSLIMKDGYVAMDGQAVFRFATRKVPECIEELLKKMKKEGKEIDHYLLHQANKRIISAIAKRMKESEEKFPMNLMEYGNTSSASIPILLKEMVMDGKIKRGDRIIMAGFGGGLTWAAAYLEF